MLTKAWLVIFSASLMTLALLSSADADLLVVESNVIKFPKNARITGNKVDGLEAGEWVRAVVIESKETILFEGPKVTIPRSGGTRGDEESATSDRGK